MDAEKPLCLHAGRTVSNWSATFSCHPDLYGEPQDLDELRQVTTETDAVLCDRHHSVCCRFSLLLGEIIAR